MFLAGRRGFEPRFTESESVVLPLNDPPAEAYPLTTGGIDYQPKNWSTERKNVDKIGPFQIDRNGFPAKMDGSKEEGIREA